MKTEQRISIVICGYTLQRWNELVAAVESVQQQHLQPEEIIVVIDHNPELLQQARTHLSGVLVEENTEQRGLSGARNCGIALAKGNIVAFLDDDAVATPHWLSLLSEAFARPDVIGAGGAIRPRWSGDAPRWFPEEFLWVVGCTYRGLPQRIQPVRNLIGANMAIRREVFNAVGGFSSEIGRVGTRPVGCEETELCIRARQLWPLKAFLYSPEAVVLHHVPANRTTWHYFRSRCYAEGLSKAVVSQLAGAKDALSSERTYVSQTLPQGVARGIVEGVRNRDISGFARAGAIIAGFALTASGYVVGTVSRIMNKRHSRTGAYTPTISTYKS
jgi:GT2 family glycosyltransferase